MNGQRTDPMPYNANICGRLRKPPEEPEHKPPAAPDKLLSWPSRDWGGRPLKGTQVDEGEFED